MSAGSTWWFLSCQITTGYDIPLNAGDLQHIGSYNCLSRALLIHLCFPSKSIPIHALPRQCTYGNGFAWEKCFVQLRAPGGIYFTSFFNFRTLYFSIFCFCFFGNLATAKEHCLAMLWKAECVSPGTGLLSTVMLDKSVEQKVVEEELTFKTYRWCTRKIFLSNAAPGIWANDNNRVVGLCGMQDWPGLKATRVQPNTGRAGELLAATEEMLTVFKHCYFCHCVSVFLMVLLACTLGLCFPMAELDVRISWAKCLIYRF